jgi:hypothetical protein
MVGRLAGPPRIAHTIPDMFFSIFKIAISSLADELYSLSIYFQQLVPFGVTSLHLQAIYRK